jgi:hypothetical protein
MVSSKGQLIKKNFERGTKKLTVKLSFMIGLVVIHAGAVYQSGV